MPITGKQCKAARALLGWDQERLRREASVGKTTVIDFERESRVPMTHNISAIRRALEEGGVVFIDENGGGRGVRLRTPGEEDVSGAAANDDGDDE